MSVDFTPILILAAVAALLCAAMVTLSWVLGPKSPTAYKSAPYECGVAPVGDARERFPVKFYLVGMLFILFDIEVVFLWSWMTVFANPNLATPELNLQFQTFSFFAVLIYMVLWIIGDWYVLKVDALNWEEEKDQPFDADIDSSSDQQVALSPLPAHGGGK